MSAVASEVEVLRLLSTLLQASLNVSMDYLYGGGSYSSNYFPAVYMPIRHPTIIGHCRGVPSSMAIPPRTLQHRARLDLTRPHFSHIDDQLRHATPHIALQARPFRCVTFLSRHGGIPLASAISTSYDIGANNRHLSGT